MRYPIIFAAAMLLVSCSQPEKQVEVKVANGLDENLSDYVVELPYAMLVDRLGSDCLTVVDVDGVELPSQITYDSLFIFQADLVAGDNSFVVKPGQPSAGAVKACGRIYPERQDDLAWENDLVGFRAYGPGTRAAGERLFGYDLFLKRDTAGPVLEMLYATDHNPVNWARVDSLRACGENEAAEEFIRSFSYHVDHGYGMDCYAVGPTLGAATAALVDNGSIVYPGYYETAEILDNGPVRFTARLIFEPVVIDNDTVTEIRTITLDAGSHFNKTEVEYRGLNSEQDVAVGIVIHDSEDNASFDGDAITYIDPTQGADNGRIFISAFSEQPATDRSIYRPENQAELPHVIATYKTNSDSSFVYYWGFGWDRADVPSVEAWRQFVSAYERRLVQKPQITTTN